jgi:hypothetical protein
MPRVGEFMYGWQRSSKDVGPKPVEHSRKERRKAAKIAYKVYKKTQKALANKNVVQSEKVDL